MAIWDFRPRGDLLTGVAVGAGVLAAPVVIPWAWSAVRPLLKMILKGGFMLYESGRGVFDEANARADEEKPRKGIEVKRTKVRLMATDQTERALAPKSKDVKVSASKQGKRKPPSETPRRRPKKGNKKPEKEE